MALPLGQISLNEVNVELGVAGTTTISLNQTNVRSLAGVPSGAISMQNLQGKSSQFAFSFAGGTNVDLYSTAIANGWPGASKLVATNTGTIQSSSTGTAALTISGAYPGGVDFINNALVVGRGGNGGNGGPGGPPGQVGQPGGSGGLALSVSSAVSITNNGTVAGGGGGGGGSAGTALPKVGTYGGSGGGGGIGVSSGGSGGGGTFGGNPGGGGTTTAAGGGGAFRSTPNFSAYVGAGGSGGGYGSSGSNGGTSAGLTQGTAGSGGAAGACTSGGSNITWVVTGNRYGALN